MMLSCPLLTLALGAIFASPMCLARHNTMVHGLATRRHTTTRPDQRSPERLSHLEDDKEWESQLTNDKVNVIAKFPQRPVGARISLFWTNGRK